MVIHQKWWGEQLWFTHQKRQFSKENIDFKRPKNVSFNWNHCMFHSHQKSQGLGPRGFESEDRRLDTWLTFHWSTWILGCLFSVSWRYGYSIFKDKLRSDNLTKCGHFSPPNETLGYQKQPRLPWFSPDIKPLTSGTPSRSMCCSQSVARPTFTWLDHVISKHFCWICVDFLLAFGWVIFFLWIVFLERTERSGSEFAAG